MSWIVMSCHDVSESDMSCRGCWLLFGQLFTSFSLSLSSWSECWRVGLHSLTCIPVTSTIKAPGWAWSHVWRLPPPPPPPPLQKQQDFPGNMGEILFLNFILQQQHYTIMSAYNSLNICFDLGFVNFLLSSSFWCFNKIFLFLSKPKMQR